MANMVNARFAWSFTPPCFLVYKCGIYHLCHIYLLLSIYIFVTYLQGENLCKSIFLRDRSLMELKLYVYLAFL